jgi:hypothetical protein
MKLTLDSHVDEEGRVWLQLLNNEGQPVPLFLCPLSIWAELKAGLGTGL